MPNEQTRKLSRFAWFTICIFILIGGIRVGLHIMGGIQSFHLDKAAQLVNSIRFCEGVFGAGEGNHSNDRILSEDTDSPVSSNIVPESPSRCQEWAMRSQRIGEEYILWHTVLWFGGALLGVGTLLVAFSVLKRNARVVRLALLLFGLQVLTAFGEIITVVLVNTQSKKLFLSLWPGLRNSDQGWLLLNSEIVSTIMINSFLCVIYLVLALMVRAKKMWEY